MAEDFKIQEEREGLEGQETFMPQPQVSQEVEMPVESAQTKEESSTEAISSPSTSSIPSNSPETVASKIELNPADGGSWEALSKEVGENTP